MHESNVDLQPPSGCPLVGAPLNPRQFGVAYELKQDATTASWLETQLVLGRQRFGDGYARCALSSSSEA